MRFCVQIHQISYLIPPRRVFITDVYKQYTYDRIQSVILEKITYAACYEPKKR